MTAPAPSAPAPEDAPRRVLLVFVDGLGIGPAGADNPVAAARLPRLESLLGGARPLGEALDPNGRIGGGRAALVAADATLGVDGLPQSGTGQTALLAGFNAAERFGRHFGSWVPTPLREPLMRGSVLARAAAAGRTVRFANALPPRRGTDGDLLAIRRPGAPPLAALAAGCPERGVEALAAGEAIASSITNERWRARFGGDVPETTPEDAARLLARLAADAELTLFAHYDLDAAGHRGTAAERVALLERLDAFLGALSDALPGDVLLAVASDHGNVEDPGTRHTRNPVPVVGLGPGRDAFLARIGALPDVAPALLAAIGVGWDAAADSRSGG